MSVDLITNVPLLDMVQFFRARTFPSALLLLSERQQPQQQAVATATAAQQQAVRQDQMKLVEYIAFDQTTPDRIAFFASNAEMEQLQLSQGFLFRFPNVVFSTKYTDAHLYIFAKWVLDYACLDTGLTSIKHDLIPFLVYKQNWHKKRTRPYHHHHHHHNNNNNSNEQLQDDANSNNCIWNPIQEMFLSKATNKQQELQEQQHAAVAAMSPSASQEVLKNVGKSFDELQHLTTTNHSTLGKYMLHDQSSALQLSSHASATLLQDAIQCYAYFANTATQYCKRSITLSSYADVNQDVIKLTALGKYFNIAPTVANAPTTATPPVTPNAENTSNTAVPMCALSSNLSCAENVTLKRSNIGKNCKIGKQSKVVDSILMENVIVGEG